jgi:hypothetical protein
MKRSTPDHLPDLPDAGCCTGMPAGTVTGGPEPSEAALSRGFLRPGLPRNDSNAEVLSDAPWGSDGALTRPGGWER